MTEPLASRFQWSGAMTDAMRLAYAADGYLILDGFVDRVDCQAMLAQSHHLIDDFDVENHRIVFSAKGQSHAASDYFMKSAANISCFLEEEAVDADGNLRKEKAQAVNKIGHALHDLDPVFSRVSHHSSFKTLAHGVGLKSPLLLQSMVICKQPFIGGEVNTHQDSTFLYTEPDTCVGFWLALEDATVENGCMWAARGEHRSPLRKRFRRTLSDASSGQGDIMEMTDLDQTDMPVCETPLPAPQGTLVVLHGRLPHHSVANRSSVSRYAYAVHLIDGEASYSDENWLQRPETMPLAGF